MRTLVLTVTQWGEVNRCTSQQFIMNTMLRQMPRTNMCSRVLSDEEFNRVIGSLTIERSIMMDRVRVIDSIIEEMNKAS